MKRIISLSIIMLSIITLFSASMYSDLHSKQSTGTAKLTENNSMTVCVGRSGNCNPNLTYTYRLYNCDGTYTGVTATSSSSKTCTSGNLTIGNCYYWTADNGSCVYTGSKFNLTGGIFPDQYTFTCTEMLQCY